MKSAKRYIGFPIEAWGLPLLFAKATLWKEGALVVTFIYFMANTISWLTNMVNKENAHWHWPKKLGWRWMHPIQKRGIMSTFFIGKPENICKMVDGCAHFIIGIT